MNAMTNTKRKKGKKPVTVSAMPTEWDTGATGPANRIGLVQEPATEFDPVTGKPQPNPNNVKRMRRVDMLERYYRLGLISARAWNAAERLRDAFEATMRSPGWPDNDRVQSSPKPDHAVAIMVDRISRFHAINRLVPREDVPIIDACVFHMNAPGSAIIDGARPYRKNGHEKGVKHLRDALERLADAMA
jgi:hypothetical protein